MSNLTLSLIRRALGSVNMPEGEVSTLDALADINIEDAHVRVTLTIDPRKAEAFEPVRQVATETLAALPGVKSATVVLTSHKKSSETSHLKLDGVNHIVAVASGKGGVGKSTLAVNLAIALAQSGRRVGLLDADFYGPSVPRLLGLEGQKPETDNTQKMVPLESHGLKVMSLGFFVDEAAPVAWRGPRIHAALVQLLRDVAWGDLDILMIDMPPGTGDTSLSLAQNVKLDGAVLVSTPQDIALLDARRGLALFQKMNVPLLGIVENMSVFLCPHCGTGTAIFGHGGARAEAQKHGIPFLGEIPLDLKVRETSDRGTPITAHHKDSPQAHAYHAIARRLLEMF